jgi:hypothetical protein
VKGGNPLFRNPLFREITAVLLFKALALTALYFAFFAAPAAGPGEGAAIFAPAGDDGSAPGGDSPR